MCGQTLSSKAPAMLEVNGLTKTFGGVKALTGVTFKAHSGRVLGLVGENGAGKSTIVKCLTGIHRPTSGETSIDRTIMAFRDPKDASDAGISAIHQEPSMFDDLTVAENIQVGSLKKGALGFLDWKAISKSADDLLDKIGADFSSTALVRTLSVAERHMVSLAQALSTDTRLIIFDEPTAALSQAEIQHLYGVIDRLKAEGKAIIFISHKFDEIFRVCDDYVVLRDGALAGAGTIADVTEDDLITMMVGREVEDIYPKAEAQIGDTVLEVDGYCHDTEFDNVTFDVRKGEILGFYGLVGSGRTEVMEAVFGLKARKSGSLRIDGQSIEIATPQDAMSAGLAYVPEDRQKHGAILPFPIAANMSLPQLDRLARGILLNDKAETALVDEFATRVAIRASSWRQNVGELSGGNQQKVVIGKWLATKPRLVILDEPTKGIDVGSKSAVHETIGALVQAGLAVVIVSSELEEVMGISDRMMVMSRGRVVAEIDRADFSGERIVALAAEAKA
jgi:rhamnose transport system ATP-binding protein